MTHAPDWNLLTAFEAVARHGSFSRAAEELNVLQPAVSRRVARLERELGVDLILRTRPKTSLTNEGQILLRAVVGGIAQVQSAVSAIARTDRREALVVNTTIGFASCFLMHRLNAYHDAYPDDVVELISRDLNDGYREEFGDAIVVFDSPDNLPGVEHRLIFAEQMIAVCSPEYRSRRPADERDLSGHRFLHLTSGIHGADWETYLSGTGLSAGNPDSANRYTSFMVYLQAALNGDGLAIGWRHLLDDYLESGRLVVAIDRQVATDRGYFCCLTRRGQRRADVHRFVEWLTSLVPV